jgi:CubicO group peptidase (beta-lactamase class C family)
MADGFWRFLSVRVLLPYTFFANIISAGGYFSTVNDFAKFGKAILSSRFLPRSVTNRWFKPSSFVEDWSAGVGRPWEIFRLKVNGQSVDAYTKSGDCK